MSSHPTTVVLFGATGDLAQQKLFPALLNLSNRLESQAGLSVLAIGRRSYERADFLEQVRQSLIATGRFNEELWPAFSERIHYYQMDFTDPSSYAGLSQFLHDHQGAQGSCQRLFYLAVAPAYYSTILSSISESGLHTQDNPCWSRIVIEKPFGVDQASARDLNSHIAGLFNESDVYRIDHYLGKETVQNLLAFRFANRIFEPLWCNDHIDHVQITVAEEEGIRNRGPYYDATGAFRDFVQNHILQLVSFISLEQPETFSFDKLSDQKQAVLSQIRVDSSQTVFGQYEGYRSEAMVDPESQTETYAMACFYIDNERWQGVPFYVRTGKRLPSKLSEISIQFKPTASALFENANTDHKSNLLTFRLQPDEGIGLRLATKTPRHRMQVESVRMEFCYSSSFREALPDAYELVFQDVLEGEQIHSLRADIIEESWRIVDEIMADKANHQLLTYRQSSWGPEEADKLLEKEGRRWQASESEVCNGVILESSHTQHQ